MKITLDIDGKGSKYKNELNIKIDYSQLYINGTEVISEEEINEIGYFLTDSKPRGDDYPDRLIISLGDDRKLKYGESNEYALQFTDPSYYTFEEIFRMILTEQGTGMEFAEYALKFKEHLIDIYDKTVEKEKTGVYREIEEKEAEKQRNELIEEQKRLFPLHYNKKESK